MADNWMRLVCSCGASHTVAKDSGGGPWEVSAYTVDGFAPEAFTLGLDAWLREHSWCERGTDGTHIRLEYEHEPPRE